MSICRCCRRRNFCYVYARIIFVLVIAVAIFDVINICFGNEKRIVAMYDISGTAFPNHSIPYNFGIRVIQVAVHTTQPQVIRRFIPRHCTFVDICLQLQLLTGTNIDRTEDFVTTVDTSQRRSWQTSTNLDVIKHKVVTLICRRIICYSVPEFSCS